MATNTTFFYKNSELTETDLVKLKLMHDGYKFSSIVNTIEHNANDMEILFNLFDFVDKSFVENVYKSTPIIREKVEYFKEIIDGLSTWGTGYRGKYGSELYHECPECYDFSMLFAVGHKGRTIETEEDFEEVKEEYVKHMNDKHYNLIVGRKSSRKFKIIQID